MKRKSNAQDDIIFFKEENGEIPIIDWLDELPEKAQDKCLAKLKRLEDLGHELRRPEADSCATGSMSFESAHGSIIESSTSFMVARRLWSLMACEGASVPPREIDKAVERKERFDTDPKRHTFLPET